MVDLCNEIAHGRSDRVVVRTIYADEEDSSLVRRPWLFDLFSLLYTPRFFFSVSQIEMAQEAKELHTGPSILPSKLH